MICATFLNYILTNFIFSYLEPKTSFQIYKSNLDSPISSIKPVKISSNELKLILNLKRDWEKNEKSDFSIVFHSDIIRIPYDFKELSSHIISSSSNTEEYYFSIPIKSYYKIEILKKKDLLYHFFFNVTHITNNSKNYSELECFGDYEYRWCRAKNICWQNKKFTFFGLQPTSKFNWSIMIPGARPIPNDYPSCRTVIQFRASRDRYPPNNTKTAIKEKSFITCRWYSMEYLWHSLFDYTLPLYWTNKLNGGVNLSNRIFTIDQNTNKKKGYQFISAYTSTPVENIRVENEKWDNTCFDDAVIGFPKSQFKILINQQNDGIHLPYEYPLEAYTGFREHMISSFTSPETLRNKCEPDPSHPRVLAIFRNSSKRHIVNRAELLQTMRDACPFCIVDSFMYKNETFGRQMEIVCNASLVVSIHGSQLSHMIWMKINDPNKPTAVIELQPYLYTCRDWYKQIADGAGIKYFLWRNTHKNATRSGRENSPNYELCIEGKRSCESCHDLLRDQPTIVNLKEFKKVFLEAVKYVSNNKKL